MLVKELMTMEVVCCAPREIAHVAANLMKAYDIGAIPVAWDKTDRLLEGIVRDRDLCFGVFAEAKNGDAVTISQWMTPVPVTCEPKSTIEDCEELMPEIQFRRIPVVNERGRCVGIVGQADIARHAPAAQLVKTINEISQPAKRDRKMPIEKDNVCCGQTHQQD
jgi:CBS domain-containing protein